MYLNSFNYFRALAIIFIVAGHSVSAADVQYNSVFSLTMGNIIAGGTTLFVFISGFLFHHIFYKKYVYQKFLVNKFRNVLIPYLILSFAPILLHVIAQSDNFGEYFLPAGESFFSIYITPYFQYLWTGRMLNGYWYIPFIIVTFLLSPVHIAFIRVSPQIRILLILVSLFAATLIQRPVDNLSVFQSVIFFTPVYLIGIACSIHKEQIWTTLAGKEPWLLVIVITLAYIQAALGKGGNYHSDFFQFNGVDLQLLQKLVLCLFFMVLLHRWEGKEWKWLGVVADTSFAIFFLHAIPLFVIRKLKGDFVFDYPWLVYPLLVVGIIIMCVAIALALKKFMGQRSRFITGY